MTTGAQRPAWLAPVIAALALRLGVVAWAAPRFPPVADGTYYQILATRLAQGQGYTWAWPDGVVTHAAHYPVGYPGLMAGLYSLFGPLPWTVMVIQAVLGAAAVWGAFVIANHAAGCRAGGVAAWAVALHPALVFYTPALMTEGVTAAGLALAGALAVTVRSTSTRRCWALVGLALVSAMIVLVRPQALLFVPFLGACVAPRRPLRAALLLLLGCLLVIAPWTLRNAVRMGRRSPTVEAQPPLILVSANAGWNLLIGAPPDATGSYVPVVGKRVPEECREVFDEAGKDRCFLQAAKRRIRAEPLRWLGLVSRKLSQTFDFCGAAGWYLSASNEQAFTARPRLALAVLETVWQRALLVAALLALMRRRGGRAQARKLFAGAGMALALTPAAWLAYVALLAAAVTLGRRLLRHPAAWLAFGIVATTALTHAVFFGAGRYQLVCIPLLAALSGCFLGGARGPRASMATQEEPVHALD